MPGFLVVFCSNINKFNLLVWDLSDSINDRLGLKDISTTCKDQYFDTIQYNTQNIINNVYDILVWMLIFFVTNLLLRFKLFIVQ